MASNINTNLRFGSLWLFLIHCQRVHGIHNESHGDPLQFGDLDPHIDARRIATENSMNVNAFFRFQGGENRYHYYKISPTKRTNLTSISNPSTVANSVTINEKLLRASHVDGRAQEEQKAEKSLEYETFNKKDIAEESLGLNPYQMVDQIKKIFDNHPSANVESEVLGRTASYNDILLYKITQKNSKFARFNPQDGGDVDLPEKKSILIVHALSSMGLSKLCSLTDEKYLNRLISFYLAHLDKFDILLMPMANPDGYLQSKLFTYWNKNVSPQGSCTGVALDRNFDVAWNASKHIHSCSQRYPGPFPFSEAESRAVKDVFNRYSNKLFAYFHVHSGTYDSDIFKGDAVLYPKGFRDSQSDEEKYMDLKIEIDEAIREANFRVLSVTVDTLYNWYGKVAGSSVDYAETIYGIPYAMELVMQIYTDPMTLNKLKTREMAKELDYYALNEIWRRIINVTFTYLWQKTKNEEY